MENQIVSSCSTHCDNFRFIPFVTASEELYKNSTKNPFASGSDLSGEEVSLFYNEVVSSPSRVPFSEPSSSKQHSQKLKKQSISSRSYNNRLTIFHHAQDGNIGGIEYCLSIGCDINVQDMYGWTPLMCAAFEGHNSVVEYLIKCGASLSIKNKQQHTALNIAKQNHHKSLIKLLSGDINENVSGSEVEATNEAKYCNICDNSYTGPVTTHGSSIAHLLSCKKDNISTFYHIPESNKGFQIMLRKGWDKNQGLGVNATGRKFPIKTILKKDRTCIGAKKEVPKVTHFGPNDASSVKKHNQPSAKLIREKTLKKWQIQKLERKSRQKEIDFRRQFNMDL